MSINNKLIDFANGELSEEEAQVVSKQLQEDDLLMAEFEDLIQIQEEVAELPLLEVPSEMDATFYKMLSEYKPEKETKVVRLVPNWLKVAAVIGLVGIGVIIGLQLNNQNSQIAKVEDSLLETKAEMASLMAKGLTSSKIKAINVSLNAPRADQEVVNILVNLLKNDESTNVRLNALEALLEIAPSEALLQKEFTEALRFEQKPVMQISLIHALVQLNAQGALPLFKDIIEDENHIDKVKDEARLGQIKML
jgi:uncharacterized protein YjgD (DUF1641 family)